MNQQRLYDLSCSAARDLLDGLESGNLHRVARNLDTIHHYMTLVETISADSLQGTALHRREQLEMLAGVTANLARSLAGARPALATERKLLRHLLASTPETIFKSSNPRILQLPAGGCISPASPNALLSRS